MKRFELIATRIADDQDQGGEESQQGQAQQDQSDQAQEQGQSQSQEGPPPAEGEGEGEGEYGGQGPFELPETHQAGRNVPVGGASCANCQYADIRDDGAHCTNENFATWNGGETKIPTEDPSAYMSDWWEEGEVAGEEMSAGPPGEESLLEGLGGPPPEAPASELPQGGEPDLGPSAPPDITF